MRCAPRCGNGWLPISERQYLLPIQIPAAVGLPVSRRQVTGAQLNERYGRPSEHGGIDILNPVSAGVRDGIDRLQGAGAMSTLRTLRDRSQHCAIFVVEPGSQSRTHLVTLIRQAGNLKQASKLGMTGMGVTGSLLTICVLLKRLLIPAEVRDLSSEVGVGHAVCQCHVMWICNRGFDLLRALIDEIDIAVRLTRCIAQ